MTRLAKHEARSELGVSRSGLNRTLFLGVTFFITSASTFGILYLHDLVTTPGPAILKLGPETIGHVVLQLSAGWRVRPNGIDKFKQCAVLIDPASKPRFLVCAFGYPAGSDRHPGSPNDAATLTKWLAGNHRTADESIDVNAHQTAVGDIYDVARTYRTSARYNNVVTSASVVEHEFVRTAGPYLFLLRTYEDAAQRNALDPIAFELAERAELLSQ